MNVQKILKKVFNWKKNTTNKEIFKRWVQEGKPSPPPHVVKQVIINDERDKSNIDILVETGTYLGDMVEAQKKNFKKIYSIELSDQLFLKASERFKQDRNVMLLWR